MKTPVTIVCLFVCALLAGALNLAAQQTTRGREFYLSFLPNYHSTASQADDSLFIYIVAEVPTSGVIEYKSRAGVLSSKTFVIDDPTKIFVLQIGWSQYELLGYNQRDNFSNNNDNEVVAKQSFHISSNNDVAVYALNKADKTSDATLVLPTSCLGTEYFVLSYKSDGATTRNAPATSYTPSEFAVVASQDNTVVTINPTAPTTKTGIVQKKITLQRGEAYLLQSQYSTAVLSYDLTGTVVSSTKPVAVFSGHQRARIPVESNTTSSRDCLYEQLLPVSVWGTKYVLTPLVQPNRSSSTGTDIYRVLASEDNTVLKLNGKVLATMAKGKYFENALVDAGYLTASKRVMVALYKKTANTGSTTDLNGDPFMMVIPPRRQYVNKYRFTNVQVDGVYKEQYVTLIANLKDVNAVKLDGKLLKVPFTTVDNSCYAYTSLPMSDGAHTLECPSPIGLYVYGYGPADSYGYVGGMAFLPDVNDEPIDIGPDQNICLGTDAVLIAKNAESGVRWVPSNGLSCDTCIQTAAHPKQTTRYIVFGLDSAGCTSSDTVNVIVRNLPSTYILGPKENDGVFSMSIGTDFNLAINMSSDNWDSLLTTNILATIHYDPAFMQYQHRVRVGSALSSDWTVSFVDSLSDTTRGIVVFRATGDTIVQHDGECIVPQFKTLLTAASQHSPQLEVKTSGKTVSCASELTRGATIMVETCAAELRQVALTTKPFALYSPAPNPSTGNRVSIHFSLGYDSDAHMSLYDISGKEVRVLVNEWKRSGDNELLVDTGSLPAGLYHCILRAAGLVYRESVMIEK